MEFAPHFFNSKPLKGSVAVFRDRNTSGGWWKGRLWIGFCICLWVMPAKSQNFMISPVTVTNGTINMNFPTRSDSYYLLHASPTLASTSSMVNALQGSGGQLGFNATANRSGSMFYRVEQIPLNSANSLQNDGIPDGWKLQQGLNPLVPGVGTNLATGYATTWLQVYKWQTNLAALPIAYFPNAATTVVVGSTNVLVPVALTKPYTGWLTYNLSGTAIPQSSGVTGDYVSPSGKVFVANSTTANISINLVPETDIEINRSIVIALSAPPVASQSYAITTNTCVTLVQIMQSTQGVYVGTLTITNGLLSGAQSVKMALRTGAGGVPLALLDVTGNSLLGNTFTVPVTAVGKGFQLNGGQFSNTVTNTPWGRNVIVNLTFGNTQFVNVTSSSLGGQTVYGSIFSTPVTVNLSGLTSSGLSYSGSGTLNLSQDQ